MIDVALAIRQHVFEPAQCRSVHVLLAHLRDVAETEHLRHAIYRQLQELAVARHTSEARADLLTRFFPELLQNKKH